MSVIRVRGARRGIAKYLRSGKKSGRAYSRDQLDTRVILAGNLDLTDAIIESTDMKGECYLHVTLSFKENNVEHKTLADIAADMKTFFLAAFKKDSEANYYAEAHLPKIKSFTDKKGETVFRYPHIHIVIPRKNLLTGENDVNPTGWVPSNIKYLYAIQSYIDHKYGLESPEDNRRMEFLGESTVIEGKSGRIFNGQNSGIKKALVDEILEKNITSYEDFKNLLATKGVTRTRNPGQFNQHEAVTPDGADKIVNLRHHAFSREFIELPTGEKLKRLAHKSKVEYREPSLPKNQPKEIDKILAEWFDFRSKEIRHINSGNRALYNRYKEALEDEKLSILNDREIRYYKKAEKKHRDRESQDPDGYTNQGGGNTNDEHNLTEIGLHPPPLSDGRLRPLLKCVEVHSGDRDPDIFLGGVHDSVGSGVNAKSVRNTKLLRNAVQINLETGRTDDSLTEQMLRDAQEKKRQAQAESSDKKQNIFTEIKQKLDPRRLLSELSRTHGLVLEHYQVVDHASGGKRIKCGSRHYTVNDFLTKEMHFSWEEASSMLMGVYEKQQLNEPVPKSRARPDVELWLQFQGFMRKNYQAVATQRRHLWAIQRESEWARMNEIREAHKAAKSKIYVQNNMPRPQRKEALSLSAMARTQDEIALRLTRDAERDRLKAEFGKSEFEKYRDFLMMLANQGFEKAIAELRKHAEIQDKVVTGKRLIFFAADETAKRPKDEAIRIESLRYSVGIDGSVTYSRNGRDINSYEGRKVAVLEEDDMTIEAALRLAIAKFGADLDTKGSAEFKMKLARVVVKCNLRVNFTNKELNKLISLMRNDKSASTIDGKGPLGSMSATVKPYAELDVPIVKISGKPPGTEQLADEQPSSILTLKRSKNIGWADPWMAPKPHS